jgi:cytoskeletal protein CcmA (bactofilin family)
MFSRSRDESGIAMITALLVSLVVLSLSVAVVGLSLHNTNQSSEDRKRIQAIHAAEAGIDAYFLALTTASGAAMCSPTLYDGNLPSTPGASYDLTITLYSTWPPADGTQIACVDPLSATPLGAQVLSKGTAVTGSGLAVSRTMETEVKLTALYKGLGQAIFSHTLLNFQNQLTINGNVSNDGDVYTNGNFSLANNTSISGSVYAQGGANISQGIVKQDVWAKNSVSLTSGIAIFGNTTSSTSSITLSSNAHIYGNAKAGTSVTGGTIDGTTTANSPSGAPPQLPFPQITYDPKPWQDAGYTIMNFATCALATAFINAMPAGNYVVRVTPACAMSWASNSVVNVQGNLAIITDGSITTINQTTWNGVGGGWTVFFLVPYRAGLNCTKPSPYDISISNNTNFNNGLKVFVYSQCNVDFGNNNAEGVNGQIIGGTVTITNQMTLNYRPIVVPGFNLTGYSEQTSYLREIVNQ